MGSRVIEQAKVGRRSMGGFRVRSLVGSRRAQGVAGVAAVVFAGLVILWAGRGLIFYLDEWAWITGRLGGSVGTYLRPHNEHLMAFPIAVFKALFVTVGIGVFWPYRLVVVLGHVACVTLLFAVVRRRVGALTAAMLAAPVLVFGAAWEVLLFPVNIAIVTSTAAGLGMLLALDREDGRGELAACALLVLALASWSAGVALAIGALMELMWRGDRWRRLWVVAVPALLYALWYAHYNRHPVRPGPLQLASAPVFAFRTAANALTSLLGVPLGVATLRRYLSPLLDGAAYALLVAALAVLARVLWAKQRLTPRMAMLLVTLGSYWLLTGVARAYTHDPNSSRYIYFGAIFVVVVAAEAAQGVMLRNRALTVAALVSCVATILNVGWLIKFGHGRRAETKILAAELTALESVRGQVPGDLQLDPKRAPDIRAGPYFHAIQTLGSSPAPSQAQLERSAATTREAADTALLKMTGAPVPYTPALRRLLAAAGRPSVARWRVAGASARFTSPRGACLLVNALRNRMTTLDLPLPRLGVVVRSDERVIVHLRRFAPDFFGPGYVLSSPRTGTFVRPGLGRSTRPWLAQFSATGPYRLC